jgi:prepilin peptidase CpaA
MESVTWWPVLILVTVATVTDLRSRRIPNWLTLPFLAAGLVLGGVTGGLAGLGRSAAGAGLAILLLAAFCLLRGMGWGDLKLCTAVGAWLGPGPLVLALIMTAAAGGFAAVAALLWRGTGYKLSARLQIDDPAAFTMPYAPAIAVGTIFALLAK